MNKNITSAPPRAAADHSGAGAPKHANAKASNGANGGALAAKLAEAAYLDADAVLALLESDRNGLTDDEVEARRERYGRNEVAHEKPPDVVRGAGARIRQSVQLSSDDAGDRVRRYGRQRGHDRHRPDGPVQHRAALRSGIPVEQVRPGAARARAHQHRGRARRRRVRAWQHAGDAPPRDPDGRAGAGRHRVPARPAT